MKSFVGHEDRKNISSEEGELSQFVSLMSLLWQEVTEHEPLLAI